MAPLRRWSLKKLQMGEDRRVQSEPSAEERPGDGMKCPMLSIQYEPWSAVPWSESVAGVVVVEAGTEGRQALREEAGPELGFP